MKEIVVLTTADSDELARKIAWALVEAGEAACVNIIPGIRSIYRWQDKVVDEGEILLFIKSSEDRFDAIRSRIRSLRSEERRVGKELGDAGAGGGEKKIMRNGSI